MLQIIIKYIKFLLLFIKVLILEFLFVIWGLVFYPFSFWDIDLPQGEFTPYYTIDNLSMFAP